MQECVKTISYMNSFYKFVHGKNTILKDPVYCL